jgi:hypothetical protein
VRVTGIATRRARGAMRVEASRERDPRVTIVIEPRARDDRGEKAVQVFDFSCTLCLTV